MPHIEISLYPGRTEDQKYECARKIAEDVAAIMGAKISSVSVAIKDVTPDDWKSEVWDKKIVGNDDILYKKPGYTCE